MDRVLEFLKKSGVYYLATCENDQPHVRPFGTVHIFENRIYIQTGLVKNVAKQLADNPKIEICAFADGKWLRVSGEAILDERIEAQKSLLDAYPSLQGMYKAGDGKTAVYYLKNATATFSSFTQPSETVTF